jgi:hypothetical protein
MPPTNQDLLQPVPPQTAASPKKRIQPFNNYARQWDPMMPKVDYEARRDFYFNTYVAPHYKNDADRQTGQQKFNTLTERKPLLTTGEKIAMPAAIAAHEFFAKATDIAKPVVEYPFAGKTKAWLDQELTKSKQTDVNDVNHLQKLAAREGTQTSVSLGKAGGDLAEMGVELEALGGVSGAAGALAEGLGVVKAGTFTAKSIALQNRVLMGGNTFGLYEGLHDERGLGHSFIDGSYAAGFGQGALWEWAGTGNSRAWRTIKHTAVGAGLGAAQSSPDVRGEGALLGGVGGVAFGVISGTHPKEAELRRALTPGDTKPLPAVADSKLADSVMQSTSKASREMKPQALNIDESLHGVTVRVSDGQGAPAEIKVAPYAEARALDQINQVTMAGGRIEGIDYSTSHGDTLNRLLRMQNTLENGSKNVNKSIVSETKTLAVPKPKVEATNPTYTALQNADDVIRTHKNLPKTSALYPDLVKARREAKNQLTQLGDQIAWAANKSGSSNEERKHLRYWLTTLVNNRGLSTGDKTVNEAITRLAYKSEMRDLIPLKFQDTFDIAQGQVPKGATFENNYFSHAKQYQSLQKVAQRRSPDELIAMSKILSGIQGGEPKFETGRMQGDYTDRLRTYQKLYKDSLGYPEVGQVLPATQRPAWDSARQRMLDTETKTALEQKKESLETPKPKSNNSPTGPANRKSFPDLSVRVEHENGNVEYMSKEQQRSADPFYQVEPNKFDEEPTPREIPDLEDLEPSEIDQVMQQEIADKSRGIESPGVMEEFLRTGQWSKDSRPGKFAQKTFEDTARIPATETDKLTFGDNARIEDGLLKVYVPGHVLADMYGADAYYMPSRISEELEKLGFKNTPDEVMNYILDAKDRWIDPMNGNLLASPGKGMVVLPAEDPVSSEFHELLHHAMDHVSGLLGFHPEHFGLSDASTKTIGQIGDAFGKVSTYNGAERGDLNEEAFVHAATAVVKGDKEALYGMGMVDTSVQQVIRMVDEMSHKALTKLAQRPDWQELRYVKDRFQTVRNNAAQNISYTLRTAADKLGFDFFPGEAGTVDMVKDGSQHRFKDKNEAFKYLLNIDDSPEAPSYTMSLEQIGVLTDSPILARFSPSRSGVTLEPSADAKGWEGRMAATELFRPIAPWVAKAQRMLDQSWSGVQKISLLDSYKKVSGAFQDSSLKIDNQRDEFAKDLKTFKSEKLYDVFNFLSTEQRFWPHMQSKYNMSSADMVHVGELDKKLRALDSESHLGIYNYFVKELPILRRNGWKTEGIYPTLSDPKKASTFYRGMLEGRFKPQDTHAGRFINYVLKASQDKALEGPVSELTSVINTKDRDGNYVLGPIRGSMERYVNYMTNRPDVSQKMINSAVSGLQDGILNQFKRINKHLPAKLQLPEEFEYPGSAINKLMSLSYVSGLGLRASVPIRDALQVVTNALPVIGFRNFARGALKGLNPEGWQAAQDAGALLHRANIGELYGDIYREIPPGGSGKLDKAVEFSNKLLAPSRWGHNVGRAIVYHGTLETANKSIRDLRAGKITPAKFETDTGLWFLDKSERERYGTMAVDKTLEPKELANRIALDMTDRTLWAYRRGEQPGMLRTGAGRIFGQYGMWPLNYGEFLRTLGARSLEGGHVSRAAITASATFLGVSLAAYDTLDKGMGVDAGKWMFLSPAGYAGGPNMEFLQALMKSPEESKDGLEARKTVAQYPLNFVPGANQMRSTLETINNPDYWDPFTNTPTDKGWLKLSGFRPVDDKEVQREDSWTVDQRIRHEAGFNTGPEDTDTVK